MAPLKVLIIGGGLSGLALAQALRKQGIAYEVFERDPALETRRQGWAVWLHGVQEDLKTRLPSDLPSLEDSASVFRPHYQKAEAEATIYSGSGEALLEVGGSDNFLRVNRGFLRSWLSLNLKVSYSKQFLRYEESDSGVSVYFSDGTTANGDVLVAADGASSAVRLQLLGEERGAATAAAIKVIVGERKMPMKNTGSKGKPLFYTVNAAEMKLFTSVTSVDPKRQYEQWVWFVAWLEEGKSIQPNGEANDHTGGRLNSHTNDHANGDVKELDGAPSPDRLAQRLQTAQRKVQHLPSHLTQIVMQSEPSDLFDGSSFTFREFEPPVEGLPRGRVTLLGDAAHAMMPFRSQGANTAITDAFDLVNGLSTVIAGKAEVHEVLKHYESVALPRGRENVILSREVFGMTPEAYIKLVRDRFAEAHRAAQQNST